MTVTDEIKMLKDRVSHLEKILIIGEGDRLPLAEIVRTLTRTVSDYIAQKDKEEQERKDQWNKAKWLVLGIVVPSFFVFVGQAVIFYFRIIPIVETLSVK
jgi:hypothetical protein